MTMTLAMHELLLSIHGAEFQFVTNSAALATSVADFFRYFTCTAITDRPMVMQFDAIDRRADAPIEIPAAAKKLYDGSGIVVGADGKKTWLCDIYMDGDRIFVDFHAEGIMLIDGSTQSTRGYLVRPEEMAPDNQVSFVYFATAELLKRKGIYTFHATALEKDGLGVLIPGFSGRGKTTTFLSLLRSGYRYVSDDHPFFRLQGDRVEMLPQPLKINVTEQTVSFFPELREASSHLLHPGIPKRYFYAEDMYPGPLGRPCEPAMILFPQVTDAAASCLEPLSKKEALELILPHSLLVYDPAVARAEFRALVRLVEQADCYRLHFGQDVLELPWLVTPLLEQRRRSLEQ